MLPTIRIMKKIEILTRILFLSNILYILVFFSIVFKPELIFVSDGWSGLNIYAIFFLTLAIITSAHWFYCLGFCFKYDRYSASLIWLILLNVIYAPFYYYQVIIKKRPLENDISGKQEKELKNEIEDKYFTDLMRERIIDVLELWSSKDKQKELQDSNPEINITKELFDQWNDFKIETPEILNEVFHENERIAIKEFDKVLNKNNEILKINYPNLKVFVNTMNWYKINNLAIVTLKKIEKIGNG